MNINHAPPAATPPGLPESVGPLLHHYERTPIRAYAPRSNDDRCTQLAFNNRHCSVPYPQLLHPTASSENKRLSSIDLPQRTNSFINCSSSNSHAFYFTLPTTTPTPSPPNSRFGCLHQPTNETTKTTNRKSDPSSFSYKKNDRLSIASPTHNKQYSRPPLLFHPNLKKESKTFRS